MSKIRKSTPTAVILRIFAGTTSRLSTLQLAPVWMSMCGWLYRCPRVCVSVSVCGGISSHRISMKWKCKFRTPHTTISRAPAGFVLHLCIFMRVVFFLSSAIVKFVTRLSEIITRCTDAVEILISFTDFYTRMNKQ